VIRIVSGKRPDVNANECQKPLMAFVAYLPANVCGAWQSLQTAMARWLDFSQPSYCSFMTWQLTHAAGSFVRYDAPFA
jgi:hypothetical protein